MRRRAKQVGPVTTNGVAAREHAAAQLRLDATHAMTPEVRRLARQLRELRERNHFAEMIEYAMRSQR
jgi:hypothetical protein